ncbi:MAG: hypothetical protein JW808_05190, partial [Victivallales bacterium]|nr:hypothetical protein [Victivallales bacterium]
VKSLPEGTYKVVATALADGQTIAETPPQTFTITPQEEWMTNTYGEADVVLPGFEPLKADGSVISLWGRTYDFNNSIMPVQIVNQDKEMLARPINWFVRVQGQDVPLTVESMKLVGSSDTRAIYEGQGKLGPLAVTAKVMVEYDGFMKFDITFAPLGAGAVEVEKLWMEVPLVPAQSRNMYHPTRRGGAWDKDWKSPLKLVYTSAITLGTPDISLQWITESDQHYYPRGNEEALETFDDKDAHVFRSTVIASPKEIRGSFSLTFALHAGPVRKRPEDWRGWTKTGRRYLDPKRHTDVANHYFDGWWCQAPGSLIPREGFPVEELKDRIDGTSMHFQGFRAFTETDPQKRLPEWEKYEEEWKRVPVNKQVYTAPGWNEIYVDSNSSWGQWHVYCAYKLFSQTGMRGLYYDDWVHGVSMNEAAGSGYVDENGIRQPTWPVFSQREIHRRTYAIIKQFRPDDGIVTIHTSCVILLPIVSFCDLMLDGEIMGWLDMRPPKGNYFDTFRLDLMQMIFSCKNYGPVPLYYEYPSNEGNMDKIRPQKQRQLWALLLSHDIHAYCSVPSAELLYFYLDHGFPLTDPGVEFHPYWDDEPAVKPINGYWIREGKEEPERASKYWAVAYSKPAGEALVIVCRDAPNNYCGPITVDVALDREKLRLPDGDLASFELESLGRKEKGTVEGGILKVPVDVDDYTAVILKAKQ